MSHRISRSFENFILLVLALALFVSSCWLGQARMDIRQIPAAQSSTNGSTTSDSVWSNDELLRSPASDLESELVKNARARLSFIQESKQNTFSLVFPALALLLLLFYRANHLLRKSLPHFFSCALVIVHFIHRSDGKTDSYQSVIMNVS